MRKYKCFCGTTLDSENAAFEHTQTCKKFNKTFKPSMRIVKWLSCK